MASVVLDRVLFAFILMILIKYTIVGFLKSILNIVKLVASVVLAIVFRGSIAALFDKWFMKNAVVGWVNGSLTKSIQNESPTVDFVKIYKDTPQFYSHILSHFGIDNEKLDAQMRELSADNVSETAETIGIPFANMLSTILAVIAIFIVSMIVLSIILGLFSKLITRGIKLTDRLLGMALGMAISAVVVWGVGVLVKTLVDMLGPVYPAIFNQELIDKSMVLGMLDKLGINSLMSNIKFTR